MKKKLTVVIGIVIIICVVSGVNLIANPTGKSGLVRIANQQRIPGPTLSLSPGAVGSCEISNDDSIPFYALASFDSGMGIAVYMDPTKCVTYPYPFKITGVHFFLKSFPTKFALPVDFQVSIRDISGGNKCNGPDSVLCSESFAAPIDSGWINLNFSQPYCVVQPFFLEVMYQSKTDGSVLPSLVMDETIQDTCDDWFLYSPDHYYSWVTYWGDPPVGDAIIRASGYFSSFECESLWYWKPAYEDYTPSGMPDFDQRQDNWVKPGPPPQWTFCGPVAVANCFWWFDSKYNVPPGLPGDGIDRFSLVRDYLDNNPPRVGFDDHDPLNVNHPNTVWGAAIGPPPATPQPFNSGPQLPNQVPSWGELVERLAWFFNTDGIQTGYGQFSGTNVTQMQQGIDMWFQSETLSVGHTLADTLYERTIKMPGFAEVESLVEKCEDVILLLGFWYENPSPGSGQWFRCGGHYVTVAGVCSDSLKIAFSDPYFDNAEAGGQGRVLNGTIIPHAPIPGHPPIVHNDAGNVSHDIYPIVQPSPSPGGIWMLPTYLVSIDPSYCEFFDTANVPDEFKAASMPWNGSSPIFTEVEYAVVISPTPPDTCWYWKPDTTNAPSGMPDFDQYQFGPPDSDAFCGPTAVANCLWWFGAVPPGVTTPDSLIRLLSYYFHTHPDSGTYVDSIQSGLDRYFADYGFSLKETTYVKPSFQEMEDSLKKCQDIILLLGFWQLDGDTTRVGGHFVTMAGVCSGSGWVAFSDPARDAAEAGRPGRVRPQVHPPHPIGNTLHNNPQFVSHDMYQALLGSPSPGGAWGLPAYDSVYQFEGHNFQPEQWQHYGPYNPLKQTFTEVEYAIMICPKPSAVEDREEDLIPKKFELYQNHPNPFNTETQIKYQLKKASFVTLSIYNILGEKVRALVKEKQAGGLKTIIWDGRDEKGNELASGIYFYELKAGEVTQTKQMVLLK